jgi:hypothetical protein
MLVDVFSLTSYYRFMLGILLCTICWYFLFMLVDVFSLTSYYRFYVGRPDVLPNITEQYLITLNTTIYLYQYLLIYKMSNVKKKLSIIHDRL